MVDAPSNPPKTRPKIRAASSLVGQLLLALPGMPDPRFNRAVIYIVTHGPEGTMGICINKPLGTMHFAELLEQLDIPLSENTRSLRLLNGGPVESGRGFVIHSDEYGRDATLQIEPGVAMTSTIDILRALAQGEGPARAILALGYAGWQPSQLETELQGNHWLTVPADADLVFDVDLDGKWDKALGKYGVTPAMLSATAGRA